MGLRDQVFRLQELEQATPTSLKDKRVFLGLLEASGDLHPF